MKYIIKEADCMIVLDSEHDSKDIENILSAVACTIMGVEKSGSWRLFNRLMLEVNNRLLADAKRHCK